MEQSPATADAQLFYPCTPSPPHTTKRCRIEEQTFASPFLEDGPTIPQSKRTRWTGGPVSILVPIYSQPSWLTKEMLWDMAHQVTYYPHLATQFHVYMKTLLRLRWNKRNMSIYTQVYPWESGIVNKKISVTTIDQNEKPTHHKSFFLKIVVCLIAVMNRWAAEVSDITQIPNFLMAIIRQHGCTLTMAFPNIKEFLQENMGVPLMQHGIWHNGIVCAQIYGTAEQKIIEGVRRKYAVQAIREEMRLIDLRRRYPTMYIPLLCGEDTGTPSSEPDYENITNTNNLSIIPSTEALVSRLEMLFTAKLEVPLQDQTCISSMIRNMVDDAYEFEDIYNKFEIAFEEHETEKTGAVLPEYQTPMQFLKKHGRHAVYSDLSEYTDNSHMDDIAQMQDLTLLEDSTNQAHENMDDPNIVHKHSLAEYLVLDDPMDATYKAMQDRCDMNPAQLRMLNHNADEFSSEASASVEMIREIDKLLKDNSATALVPEKMHVITEDGLSIPMLKLHSMTVSFAAYAVIKEAFENITRHDMSARKPRDHCNICIYRESKTPCVSVGYCRVMASLRNVDTFNYWMVVNGQECVYCRTLAMIALMIVEMVKNPDGNFDISKYDVLLKNMTVEQIDARYDMPFGKTPFISVGKLFLDSIRFYCNVSHVMALQMRKTKAKPSDVQCDLVFPYYNEAVVQKMARIDIDYAHDKKPANTKYLVALDFKKDRYFDVMETINVIKNYYIGHIGSAYFVDNPDEPPFVNPCMLPGKYAHLCTMAMDSRLLSIIQRSVVPLLLSYARHQPYSLRQCPYYPLAIRNYYTGDSATLHYTMNWLRRMMFSGKQYVEFKNGQIRRAEEDIEPHNESLMFAVVDSSSYRILHQFIGCFTTEELVAELKKPFGNRMLFVPSSHNKKDKSNPDWYSARPGCINMTCPTIYSAMRAFLHPMHGAYKFTKDAMATISKTVCLIPRLWVEYPIVVEALVFAMQEPDEEVRKEITQAVAIIAEERDTWNVLRCEMLYNYYGRFGWYAWKLIQRERICECVLRHRPKTKTADNWYDPNDRANTTVKLWHSLRTMNRKKFDWAPRDENGELILDNGYIPDPNGSTWCMCAFCRRMSSANHMPDACPVPETEIDFEYQLIARGAIHDGNYDSFVKIGRYSRLYPDSQMPLHYEIYRMASDPRVPMGYRKDIFMGCLVDTKEKAYMGPSKNSPLASLASVSACAMETNKYIAKMFMENKFAPGAVKPWHPHGYHIPEWFNSFENKTLSAAYYEILRVHSPKTIFRLVAKGFLRRQDLNELIERGVIFQVGADRPSISKGHKHIELRESRFNTHMARLKKGVSNYNDKYFMSWRHMGKYGYDGECLFPDNVCKRYFDSDTGMIKSMKETTTPFTIEEARQDNLSLATKLTYFFGLVETLSHFNHLTPPAEPFREDTTESFSFLATCRSQFTAAMAKKTLFVYDDVSLALSETPIPVVCALPREQHRHLDERPRAISYESGNIFPLWQSRLRETHEIPPSSRKVPTQRATMNPMASADNEAIAIIISHSIHQVDYRILARYGESILDIDRGF